MKIIRKLTALCIILVGTALVQKWHALQVATNSERILSVVKADPQQQPQQTTTAGSTDGAAGSTLEVAVPPIEVLTPLLLPPREAAATGSGAPADDGSTGCADDDARCPSWAKMGECRANPVYMLQSCRKSCAPDSSQLRDLCSSSSRTPRIEVLNTSQLQAPSPLPPPAP